MAEAITLADIAFGVGLLTAVFGFYWRFIRTGVEWQKDMEARMRMIEESVRRHEAVDTKVLAAIRGVEHDIGEIKTKIAVLEERSKKWADG